jgi:methylated-DNA-protein-cysteine methyltransferase-like protein
VPGMSDRNARVYAAVLKIPRGKVATYGQVARMAGLGRLARQVGYALYALPANSSVPWHRVVNAQGAISARSVPGPEFDQRVRLELEGVRFGRLGRVPLALFQFEDGGISSSRQKSSGGASSLGVAKNSHKKIAGAQ